MLITVLGNADVDQAIENCAKERGQLGRIQCLERALRDTQERSNPTAEVERVEKTLPTHTVAEVSKNQEAPKTKSVEPEVSRTFNRVVKHHFVGHRKLQVTLDNGQVWRQLDSDLQTLETRLPRGRDFDVEFKSSRSGGQRMRIENVRRTLRVKRLK